jgi:hypothetical protein
MNDRLRELVAGHVFRDTPRFSVGQLVATPGAIATMDRTGVTAESLLRRHQSGDWGNVPPEDAGERAGDSPGTAHPQQLWRRGGR